MSIPSDFARSCYSSFDLTEESFVGSNRLLHCTHELAVSIIDLVLMSDIFLQFTKRCSFQYYPIDLVNSETNIPLKDGEQC